jgi:hypothetical protein
VVLVEALIIFSRLTELQQAAQWIETTPLSADQREKICYRNAESVLELDATVSTASSTSASVV